MKNHEVIFQPSGRKVLVSEGVTLLEAARLSGVMVDSPCGGQGTCGKCRIRIMDSPPDLPAASAEEVLHLDARALAEGYRLACRLKVRQPLVVETAGAADGVTAKAITGGARGLCLDPAVRLFPVSVPASSPDPPRSDAELLLAALKDRYSLRDLQIDLCVLRSLPKILRQADWRVTAAVHKGERIIALFPGAADESYGLAVDVGTTTLAAYLCSLSDGRLLAADSLLNPQVAFGDDVIARIAYAGQHRDGTDELRGAVLEGLNRLLGILAGRTGVDPSSILEALIVGNTTMHHLLLGLDPSYLGAAPFPAVLRQPLDIPAREVGLALCPAANVHLLPVKAGFVGADIIAALLAVEPQRLPQPALIIDVGTNGEMVLAARGRFLCASCATGPALEGAHIRFGMRAAPGAIERVRIDAATGEVSLKIIGEGPGGPESPSAAKGICGSGIIDAVAELSRAGIIDPQGAFRLDRGLTRLRHKDQTAHYVLAWQQETSLGEEIIISQKDIRNVQLAKAALYAGAKLLMKRLEVERLEAVVLAGAFGSYIDKTAALRLGMFPDCDPERIFSAGNAAGQGALLALLSRGKRREALDLTERLEYVELTAEPGFQEEFLAALAIPHLRDPFVHLK